MHLVTYDSEPATVKAMHQYATESGYEIDMNQQRLHHEIYLSDPRKSAPDKLKTVIRHPIKKQRKNRPHFTKFGFVFSMILSSNRTVQILQKNRVKRWLTRFYIIVRYYKVLANFFR
uniref:GyrI-like domain-containing protein n=1 Tax=Exercitatus varius TaxID=67857 RepID=UPI00374F4142